MANSKISALTSAATPLAGTETLPIVQSGATKQVSVANLTAGRAITASNLDAAIIGATTPANGTFTLVNGVSGNPQVGYFANTNTASGTISTQVQLASYNGSSVTVGTYLLETSNGWSSTNFAGGVANTTVLGGLKSGGVAIVSVNASAPIRFLVGGESSASEKWRINSTGNLVPFVAAKGIDFSANTPAAGKTSTLLNWYEEGAFTPAVSGTTIAGVGTYSSQVGKYTRIGNLVTIKVFLNWTAHTGTGNLVFIGLPFTVANDGADSSITVGYLSNLALTALNVLTLATRLGTTQIQAYQYPVGGGAVSTVPLDTAAIIEFSGTYNI